MSRPGDRVRRLAALCRAAIESIALCGLISGAPTFDAICLGDKACIVVGHLGRGLTLAMPIKEQGSEMELTQPGPPKLSWVTVGVIGALAIVMGLFFFFIRPLVVLLPEDQRYTALTADQLRSYSPQLFSWIGMVFRSWGAFSMGLGISITGIALFAYRQGETWAQWLLVLIGAITFGLFLAINIVLGSDFKLLIGVLLAVYMGALFHGRKFGVARRRHKLVANP